MSFYPQPYKYQCGPFALKYGLVMLGKIENEKEISKRAGSSWWYGTDEIGLSRAAKSFDCGMKYFTSGEKALAIKHLIGFLRKGNPCILSVDNWGHWVTVINEQNNKFIIVDSDLEKVIEIYSHNQLLKRWIYTDKDTDETSFDGYALFTNNKPVTKANFSLDKARFVMRKTNKDLAEKWDKYFNDLIQICKPRNPLSKKIISFTEFLRRHEKLLVEEIADWHGKPAYKELKKTLKNMQFVADVYDLVIRAEDQKKVLVDLAGLLMFHFCGKYGSKPIY
ncbi:MAG: hypothetical protein Q8903_01575 [Bacteroidota bacterium]|nr:hypothetical protein [Bacteroidota bacterium]